jgi:hypothetical protein
MMSKELAQMTGAAVRAHSLPLGQGCEWLDDVVWPHYDGLSIANVPASMAAAFGVTLPGAAPPLDARLWPAETRARRVVFIVLDGFGYNLLQALRDEPAIASAVDAIVGDGVLAPVTSVFPSTTASALSTLWTGYPPAGHGILGTRMLMREWGVLMSTLGMASVGGGSGGELVRWGMDPSKLIPAQGMASVLAAAGVSTHLVIQSHLAGSGLSLILHRGIDRRNMHGMRSFVDMWVLMDEVMEATRGERCAVVMYWGGLDAVSHSAGARSKRALAEARAELHHLRAFVEQWAGRSDETLLIVLADHGHTDMTENLYHADFPGLASTFRMPFAAEGRARFLFLRDGAREAARGHLRRELGGRVMALDAAEALAAGLFGGGTHHPEAGARVGDMLAICREGVALYDPLDHYVYTSQHGALCADEMLVPLVVRRM